MARNARSCEIVAPKQAPDSELIKADLDPGERDAILLAQELGADELIIDDMGGRREAQRRRLPFIGTLGVLRLAGDQGLLDFKKPIAQLRNTNVYIEPKLLDRLIRGEEV